MNLKSNLKIAFISSVCALLLLVVTHELNYFIHELGHLIMIYFQAVISNTSQLNLTINYEVDFIRVPTSIEPSTPFNIWVALGGGLAVILFYTIVYLSIINITKKRKLKKALNLIYYIIFLKVIMTQWILGQDVTGNLLLQMDLSHVFSVINTIRSIIEKVLWLVLLYGYQNVFLILLTKN